LNEFILLADVASMTLCCTNPFHRSITLSEKKKHWMSRWLDILAEWPRLYMLQNWWWKSHVMVLMLIC